MRTRVRAAAFAATCMFALAACGGGGEESAATGPAGDPVSGGTARLLIQDDPRSLDPALLSNDVNYTAAVGNALYGQLIVNDPETGELTHVLAESLETSDAGATFTLTLKPDLVHSDGTPFTAEDVKFNWERMADPATGSPYAGNAREIDELTVTDDRTLKIALRNPNAQFSTEIVETALNWIAKPDTLRKGAEEVNDRPIGAGPFTLTEWRRQDVIALERNDNYFDQPRPYLDALEIRMIADEEQRLDTVLNDGADLAQEAQSPAIARATDSGMQVARSDIGGGIAIVFNTQQAPFDDVRARQAINHALDLELVDDAVNQGTGVVPTHLFPKESPYYKDIPLHTTDKSRAQTLLDELAAEGTPLTFSLTVYSSPSAQRMAQSVQTQLGDLRNLTLKIRTIEHAEIGGIFASRDFEAITSSVPANGLWIRLRGGAGNNYSGIDDPEMNRALDASRRTNDDAELTEHYEVVQRRLAELSPIVYFQGLAQTLYAREDVGGIAVYGRGSPRVDQIWLQPS
ncbi:peptide/nickel transport system substrate-binding protein [Prauserella sediminis]|uniref:Peptide/nickel transport system substrate-binding protein n=1 Tax=Prauserella sediminis TaxID=577680 RepID=A0A839XP33_9PSEU|nr:ABC transporter substrate-binding protein [Prauserella sediminis]MBB3665602.1 peptide/nickel transport system substrate-binding protein [Prauserella sediminis]